MGYITVFVQRMIGTSDEIERDWVLRTGDATAFREKMREMKPQYKNLRIGLVGDLSPDLGAEVSGNASPVSAELMLCDKPYYDRYVTIDGYLTPCCIMTNKDEWKETALDRPLESIFTLHPAVTGWFGNYERSGHKQCENCNLISPLKRHAAAAA